MNWCEDGKPCLKADLVGEACDPGGCAWERIDREPQGDGPQQERDVEDTEKDGLQAAFDRLVKLGIPFVASDVIQLHEATARARLADTATRAIDEVAASVVHATEAVNTTLVELPGMVESAERSIGTIRRLLRHELKARRVKELVEQAEKVQAAVLAAARTSDWLSTNIGPNAESSAAKVRAALESSESSGAPPKLRSWVEDDEESSGDESDDGGGLHESE